jgi:hypothetical protein
MANKKEEEHIKLDAERERHAAETRMHQQTAQRYEETLVA